MEKQRKDSKKCCERYHNPSEEENSENKKMVLKDNKNLSENKRQKLDEYRNTYEMRKKSIINKDWLIFFSIQSKFKIKNFLVQI